MPKVLISDALSPAAVQIFKDRGIDVDFQPTLGKDKARITGHCGNVGSHYQARLRGLKSGFAAEPVSDGGNASPERALRWYRSSYEG